MNKINLFILLFVVLASHAFSQKSVTRYVGQPMFTDSLSTMFFPTRYNEEFLSNNKIAFWGDYYANIIAYNFKTDNYRRVFEKYKYIESIGRNDSAFPVQTHLKIKNITSKWIFLLIKPTDTNENGRIDEHDPSVLFAVSMDGQTLKQITTDIENVVSFDNYEKQGFLLLRIQKDSNSDGSFKAEDKIFYYRTVKLTDLSLGKKIDVN